ncbi:hypothetical protein Smp_194260 [Schistosoma mansoni]|nr:hypothetical protein Smp_194260 [Schistosoma mansoni]|eukprot:XP_018647406.1 hypothetical protein Smp_194260 [Schistosoma mansoni]
MDAKLCWSIIFFPTTRQCSIFFCCCFRLYCQFKR